MKKICTTLVAILATIQISYGQWSSLSGNIYPTTLTNRLGLGTNTPQGPLHIVRTGADASTNYASLLIGTTGTGTNIYGPIIYLDATSATGGRNWGLVSSGQLDAVATGAAGNFGIYQHGAGTRFVINNIGNIGIGTITPGFKLDVNGVINSNSYMSNAHGVYVDGATGIGMNNGFGKLSFRTNNVDGRMVIGTDGNVGIGSTNPVIKLDVQGDIGKYDPYEAKIQGLRIGVNAVYGASGARELSLVNKVSASRSGSGGNAEKYIIRSDGFDTYLADGAGNLIYNGTGSVGIGTTTPDAKLAVNGTIHTKEVKVDMQNWPDYVFTPKYKLLSLAEVKNYININQHLPEMPSEAEVAQNGVNLGEMVKLQTKKIEELTLYLIEKDKQVKDQQIKNEELESRLQALEKLAKGK